MPLSYTGLWIWRANPAKYLLPLFVLPECFIALLSSVSSVLYSFVKYVFPLSITFLLPEGCPLPFYHQICWWWILSAFECLDASFFPLQFRKTSPLNSRLTALSFRILKTLLHCLRFVLFLTRSLLLFFLLMCFLL